MAQDLAHKRPLCKRGLIANSILFFCINNPNLKSILQAYNSWSDKNRKFNLTGEETAFALSMFDTIINDMTPEQRSNICDIEMRYMSPDEIAACLGK